MISVHFQEKPFNSTVIQVCALNSNAEVAEVDGFYEDLQDLLELAFPPKLCPFHHRAMECQSRNQEIPGITGKFDIGIQKESR